MTIEAPYGAWASPITPATVAGAGVRLGQITTSGGSLYWQELRPAEGGRTVVCRRGPDGTVSDVTPEGFNVRSRVHEYGGGAYLVVGEAVVFSNDADQRLYRQDPGADPVPITPEPERPRALRYADGAATPDGRWIVCVRESHPEVGEAVNELVVVPLDGSAEPRSIVSGNDFYAFPRPSPDGSRLCWTTWNHPNMPWDGTELWVADLGPDGAVSGARRVAGGVDESVFGPRWSPDGTLHFVADRTGWWNLYRLTDERIEPLHEADAEFGVPQWVFGMSTYAFVDDGTLVCAYTSGGRDHLARIVPGGGLEEIEVPQTDIGSVEALGRRAAYVGASPTEHAAIVLVEPSSGDVEIVRRASDEELDEGYLSVPEAIEFPTEGGRTAHALFYPPANADHRGPSGEKPPLLVLSHGGPTSAHGSSLDMRIQFWTSRGFAVVDVNYGGSTGYGRAYRDRLKENWGVVDVEDCVNAARYLADRGDVDPERMAIRGGSAGGYTTLCALTFTDVFRAGTNYYGVADAETLAQDTHKFESRYLDGLIGPYPEMRERYRERSPVHFADRISCPVITFQGLEDEVVPPSQSEGIVEALDRSGLPHAYVAFPGEQHGFRKAETTERALGYELSFYGQVFGFDPADDVEPVRIENL